MNSKIWSQIATTLIVIIAIAIFALPYRGTLLGGRVLPVELIGVVTPSKRIVDEALIVSYIDPKHYISYYDELFREIAVQHNIHWCLLSAIAYVESRFKPHAVSYSGAIGMMQIMPRIARSMGIDPKDLYDPAINVRAAIRHYKDINRMLAMPDSTAPRDRISLILASYNGGVGRVFDAQRLTRIKGGDPHLWCDVEPCFLLLREVDEEHDHAHAVRFGNYKMAHYTVNYVRDVLSKYDEYRERTAGYSTHLYPYALHYERSN